MWYLQTDTLFRIIISIGIMIILSGLTRLIFKKDYAPKVLVLFDIAILCYVSWQLAAFAVGYTIITFVLVRLLNPLKKARRPLFVIFSFLCTIPFFYGRMTEFLPGLPVIITFIGIAYHMLKAIDALYFTYYTEMKIPFLTYINYMLFFPTFTAGPIFRYRDFSKVFNKPAALDSELFLNCVKRFIKGMFKKMVVMYFVSQAFSYLMGIEKYWYISFLIVVLSYITVYLDLSGYSDMAIAAGSVMGYTVPENFRKPLSAASFTQFWRNWHITLSDWVREHIFVVLNGKRLSRLPSAAVGFCTMFVMEMWHGFSLPYIVGGIYNGLCLGLENLFGLTKADKRKMNKFVYGLRCFAVNFLFAFNTLLFTVSTDQFFDILRGFIKF